MKVVGKRRVMGPLVGGVVAVVVVGMWSGSAFGVHPKHWVAADEGEFLKGSAKSVVVTSSGEVRLGRGMTYLAGVTEDEKGGEGAKKKAMAVLEGATSVHALARGNDGTIYVGTGNEGRILAVKEGKATLFAKVPGDQPLVTAMLVDGKNQLYVAASGEVAGVYRYDLNAPPAPPPASPPAAAAAATQATEPGGDATTEPAGPASVELLGDELRTSTAFIWSLAMGADGTVYAAGGGGSDAKAKLIAISGGKAEVVFTSKEENFVGLAVGLKGEVYVGSAPNGLLYRVDVKAKKGVVLLDAAEAEVSAIVVDKSGVVYAATGAAVENGEQSGDRPDHSGMPDVEGKMEGEKGDGGGMVPIPSPEPVPPNQPVEPAPRKDEGGDKTGAWNRLGWGDAGEMAEVASPLDSLRGMMKKLGAAESKARGGKALATPSTESAMAKLKAMASAMKSNAPAVKPPAEGNAVYRVDGDGFVSEVFRGPVTVYAMAEKDGVLTLATGPDGLVLQVDVAREEVWQVARAESKDVTALLPGEGGGGVLLGMSNPVGVAELGDGLAEEGTYTSPVLDAGGVAKVGTMQLEGLVADAAPAGGKGGGGGLMVSTRSGNVEEASDETWSEWSAPVPAQRYVKNTSPAGRYFQYRFTFKAEKGRSAVLRGVDVAYQLPNGSPKVSSISVSSHGGGSGGGGNGANGAAAESGKPATGSVTISWEAEDPNEDAMQYTLQYRQLGGTSEEGVGEWRALMKESTNTSFELDTRTLPDGRYQVRVVASDAPDNAAGTEKTAARVSAPFLVDNTPPALSKPVVSYEGDGVVIRTTLTDVTGVVASCQYRIDAAEEWQSAAADDGVFDSPVEAVTVRIRKLAPGRHVVTIKGTDGSGNERFESVGVEVK